MPGDLVTVKLGAASPPQTDRGAEDRLFDGEEHTRLTAHGAIISRYLRIVSIEIRKRANSPRPPTHVIGTSPLKIMKTSAMSRIATHVMKNPSAFR